MIICSEWKWNPLENFPYLPNRVRVRVPEDEAGHSSVLPLFPLLFPQGLRQYFSNFRVQQNHLEDLLHHRLLGSIHKVSDLIHLV